MDFDTIKTAVAAQFTKMACLKADVLVPVAPTAVVTATKDVAGVQKLNNSK